MFLFGLGPFLQAFELALFFRWKGYAAAAAAGIAGIAFKDFRDDILNFFHRFNNHEKPPFFEIQGRRTKSPAWQTAKHFIYTVTDSTTRLWRAPHVVAPTGHEPRATSHQHFNSFPRCEEVGSAFYAVEAFFTMAARPCILISGMEQTPRRTPWARGPAKPRSASKA